MKSIGLDAYQVAKGKADGVIKIFRKKRNPFEGPAIYLMVTEAGGKVTGFNGET